MSVPTQARPCNVGTPSSVALGIAALPPHVRELLDATYLHAYTQGLADGRAAAEAAEATRWQAMAERIVALGTSPTAADLAERRGQHARAAAIRTDLQRRGLGGDPPGPLGKRKGPSAPHAETHPGTSAEALTTPNVMPSLPHKRTEANS